MSNQPASVVRGRRRARRKKTLFSTGYRISLLALSLLLLLMIALSVNAHERLSALRKEREEIRLKHEERLSYYQEMRQNSGIRPIIERYAAEYQVNPSFISAIIARESHYDPYAQSHVGARGLMQIMEDTGTWIAKKLRYKDYRYEHLFDPDINIRFGSWYLAYLSDQFGGNPVMVAAAYHAGVSNVNSWALRYAKDERILDLNAIPTKDTKDYVGKVINAYALYHELDNTP